MRKKPIPHPRAHQEDTHTALGSSHAIASVGIATLKMLETLLPVAATEVERASQSLSDHFTTIITYIDAESNVPSHVRDAIGGVIMGMQFQDRNTQIMDNVAGMLERYRSMLEDICNNIDSVQDGNVQGEHDVKQAVDSILSGIRLNDIRSRYMEALAKAKVPGHANNLTVVAENEPYEEIELF